MSKTQRFPALGAIGKTRRFRPWILGALRGLSVLLLATAGALPAAAGDASQVVTHSIPSSLSCGESRTVTIKFKNTGTTTWTRAAGYKLGPKGDSDPLYSSGRIPLPSGVSVAPGQSYTFQLTLQAPTNSGSYFTDWRLIHVGSGWFGAVASRSVSVSCVNASSVTLSTLPSSFGCAESVQASVRMKNTGTTTWTRAAGYKFGPVGDSDPFYSSGRIELPSNVSVAPGQSYTFNITLASNDTSGSFVTDWRMLQIGSGWFGAIASRTVSVTCVADAAEIVAVDLPSSLACDETFDASVTLKNTGSATWTRGGNYKFGPVGDSDPLYSSGRILLPSGVSVAPHQTYTFNFTLTAPSTSGSHLTDWRMIHVGAGWFGPTAQSTVAVSCVNATNIVASDFPASFGCVEDYQASVTVKNTGDTTWTADKGYKLGPVGDSDPFYSSGRIPLPAGVSVAPGQTHTFHFTLSSNGTAGTHLTDWRMFRVGSGWFGTIASATVPVNCVPDAARVVASTLPATMACGEERQASVTWLNTGSATWTREAKYRLAAVDDSDPLREGYYQRFNLPPGETIAPGESRTFTFSLYAPFTPGTYLTDWRMIHVGAGWFGDVAAANVVVTCDDVDAAEVVATSLPSAMDCGASYPAQVTMRNTGSSIWSLANGFKLGAIDNTDPFAAAIRFNLPSGVIVPPGSSHTFSFTLTAPNTAGSYTTDWKMVHQGAGWFGETAARAIEVGCGLEVADAEVVEAALPTVMACGGSFQATVTMRNVGTTTWTRADGFYRLRAGDGSDPFREGAHIQLPPTAMIAPGETHTFTFDLQAPPTAGSHLTDWRMHHDTTGGFGEVASALTSVDCSAEIHDSAVVSTNLPATMACEGTYDGSVTLRNTGTTTWTRDGGFYLRAVGHADPFAPVSVFLPAEVAVTPGQSHVFPLSLTAPAAAGDYETDWRLYKTGSGYRGETASRRVAVDCSGGFNDAELLSADVPSLMGCGLSHEASATLRNTGTTTWTAEDLYRLRALGGEDPLAASLAQPLAAGTTVAPGQTHTFSWTMTAPATESSLHTDWRMQQPGVGLFGEILARDVEVSCLPLPQVDSIAPDTLPAGQTTNVTLSGENLSGATVSVETETAAGGAPTVELLSINPAGTEMVVRIDASGGGSEGFYGLRIETPTGVAGAAFRVVGSSPVVDFFSPSQAIEGNLYVLNLLGINLAGATLAPGSGAVTVLDYDNSNDEALVGLIHIAAGTPPGPHDIQVLQGGLTQSVSIEVLAAASEPAPTTRLVGGDPGTETNQSATPTPEIYMQEPVATESLRSRAGQSGLAFDFCFTFFLRKTWTFQSVLFTLYDLETGGPLTTAILNELLPGDLLRFRSIALVVSGSVGIDIAFTICTDGNGFLSVCLYGSASMMVPAVGGQRFDFSYCLQDGTLVTSLSGSGLLANFGYSTRNECMSVRDVDPGSPSGSRIGEVEVACCAPNEIDVGFTGNALGFNFDFGPGTVREVEPTCTSAGNTQAEYTAVAWVNGDDAAAAMELLRPQVNTSLKLALNPLNTVACGATLLYWKTNVRHLIDSDEDRQYANAFLLRQSPNSRPPSSIDFDEFKSEGDFRLFNRVKVGIWERTDGTSFAEFLPGSEALVGRTPIPCVPFFEAAPQEHALHGEQQERTEQFGIVTKAYQVASGRLGTTGQKIDMVLNQCDLYFAGGFPRCSNFDTEFTKATPWIWAVPVIGADGSLLEVRRSIFPSFVFYDQDGAQIEAHPQANAELFIAFDHTYQFSHSDVQ